MYEPLRGSTPRSTPRYKDPSYDPHARSPAGGRVGTPGSTGASRGADGGSPAIGGAGGSHAAVDGSMEVVGADVSAEDEHLLAGVPAGGEYDPREADESRASMDKRKTLRPVKEHRKGTRRAELHEKLRETFSSGVVPLEKLVKLPPGEDRNEWMAVHVIDFYNDVSLLYGTIGELCTADSCPVMSAGSKYTYLWADGVTIVTPIKCPAPQYVDYLMQWVDDQISNEDLFPMEVGQSFPSDFEDQMRVIFKRLFRVYAHMYRSHFKQFERLGVEQHLHMCFRRFILFSKEFNAIDEKEMAPLRKLVDKIRLDDETARGEA